MKNLRKLVTLLLALVMLVSVFALPALAAEDECDHASEIQPRYLVIECARCHKPSARQTSDFGTYYGWFVCSECGYRFHVDP